ncbi:LysR family transcriptional regulator [Roseovarius spongiae]|uniref:LysR family transcriptional regulator n=1 Tax=Roseovarius spongiae TaxID=2320272 RepID=A0A3A8B908_9RHOB|nr:LysR substrate-binding domain-containing protein [Roseovarius spongiae]RKF14156.1 LysR family transcriptional regulator [Roseovarius spongiae]
MARANIRQIEAFNAVIKGGSVTSAAKSLFISQPAVSKLIRAFEESCGFALFTRASGRLSPTPEARRLYLETEKLITGVARIENTARAIRDLERGEVSAVAYPAISLRLFPMLAAQFLAERPDVRLSIMTRGSRNIADSMLTQAADFGISLIRSDHPGLRCQMFTHCSMICALPTGHPLAREPVIDLRMLEGERLISLGRDDQSRGVVQDAFDRAGVRLDATIKAQMADTACMFVREGQGISLVPSLTTIGWGAEDLVFRPIEPSAVMPMWLYTSAYERMPELARKLLDTLETGINSIEDGFRIP